MRVLLAYDGSPGADQAVALAAAIAWPAGSLVRVISVTEPPPLLTAGLVIGESAGRSDALAAELVGHHEEQVSRVIRRLPGAEGAVRHGRAATVLVDEAAAFRPDVMIVGSRGHGPIKSLLLGSVSAELVDHAPCPVLVARRPTITKILLATDGSAASMAAEAIVARWPIAAELPVRVLSVAEIVRAWHTGLDPVTYDSVVTLEAEDAAAGTAAHDRIAEEATARLRAADRQAVATIRRGDPAHEILDEAAESAADLVVVGSRGHTGLARVFLGSVARNVLHGSSASVLVVHADRVEAL
jgi:nucleotide-binding universal stress UspA family protein